jgi:hypothetical protein
MDRPLRDVPDGRHFHVAAPSTGTGTLEVNAVREPNASAGFVEVVCREHWSGTWAGGAMLDLVQALAVSVGDSPVDTPEPAA